MKLRNPAVLITSGVKRIGLLLTREALLMGYDVIAQYRSSPQPLRNIVSRDPALSDRVRLIRADITVDNAPEFIREAASHCTTFAGLVNNASLFNTGSAEDTAGLHSLLVSNALIPTALTGAIVRRMRTGWIINVTDAYIAALNSTYQNYRISKLLLEELTRQHAFLFAPAIRVNAIAPGAILPARGSSRAEFLRIARAAPLKHAPASADIRKAFSYLATSQSTTGQVLYVDCGRHLER